MIAYHDGPDDEEDPFDTEDGDYDAECGGWIDGRFSWQMCTLAGTEYCDWNCPFAEEHNAERIAEMKGTAP